jgi:hypothetical protein
VLGELVRTYQLPESFAEVIEPEPLEQAQPAPLPFPTAGGMPPEGL